MTQKPTPPPPPESNKPDDSSPASQPIEQNGEPPIQPSASGTDDASVDASGLSKQEAFMAQAALIIAMERGINARSQVKLRAAADEAGLSPAEFAGAMLDLQSGGQSETHPEKSDDDQALLKFRQAVGLQLEKLPRGILTADLEANAVQFAGHHFGLTPEQAAKTIREVAAEKKVQRITQSEAERLVTDMIAQKLGDAAWIDSATSQRLAVAGGQWGLSVEQVESLIQQHSARNKAKQQAENKTIYFAGAIGALVLVVLGCFIAYTVLVDRNGDGNEVVLGTDDGEVPVLPPSTPPDEVAKPPVWFDESTAIGHAAARRNLPAYHQIGNAISGDVDARIAAYPELISLAKQSSAKPSDLVSLRDLTTGCYALDPEDAAADALADALLSLPDEAKKQPLVEPEKYATAYWGLNVAMAAAADPRASDERRKSMADRIGRVTGVPIDETAIDEPMRERAFAALASEMYRQLSGLADDQPALANKLQQRLSEISADYLAADEHVRLDTRYLTAAIPAAPGAWRDSEAQIRRCVASTEPLNVLQMLELYERTDDEGLHEHLADLLLYRVGRVPKSMEEHDVALAVRDAFGAPTPVAEVDYWEKVGKQMRERIAARTATPRRSDQMLDEILQTAHTATLVFAVAREDNGAFDEISENAPRQLAVDRDPTRPRADSPFAGGGRLPANEVQANQIREYIQNLSRFSEAQPVQRVTWIRGLSQLAERVREVEPKNAEVIVRYLFSEKDGEAEHRDIAMHIGSLARWINVRLAMADLVEDAKLDGKQLAEIISEAIGERVSYSDAPKWRDDMKAMLLKHVLKETTAMRTVRLAGSGAAPYDSAGAEMKRQYQFRARIAGLPPGNYQTKKSAAQILVPLITRQAAALGGRLSGDDKSFIADLPHRMRVIEYLGDNDIRRMVLLQRVYVRLTSIGIALERPADATESRRILNELSSRDSASENLLHQMRDGEAALLRLWSLYDDG